MSYMGGLDYLPVNTVDEVADVTDMMGQASQLNQAGANKRTIKNSPTKALVMLWVLALALYTLLSYYFRRFVV